MLSSFVGNKLLVFQLYQDAVSSGP